jgi:hypothetical protein
LVVPLPAVVAALPAQVVELPGQVVALIRQAVTASAYRSLRDFMNFLLNVF